MGTYKHHLYPRYLAKRGEIPPWGDPEAIVEVTYTQHMMFHWCNYQLWGNPEDMLAYGLMNGQTEDKYRKISKLGVDKREKMRKIDPEYDRRIGETLSKNGKAVAAVVREMRKNDSELDLSMREAFSRNVKAAVKVREERRGIDKEYDQKFRKNSALGPKARDERRGIDSEYDQKFRENCSLAAKSMHKRREIDPEFDQGWRDKQSKAMLGSKNPAYGKMWVTNGEENKRITKGDPIPEGFIPGMKINKP